MIFRVHSFILQGIDAAACEIEVDLSTAGLPRTTVVGLPDAAVRESIERVRAALENTGLRFPRGRITVNLAPADVRKEGPVYDLPLAVALLMADGTIEPPGAGDRPRVDEMVVAGELALDGQVRPIRGAACLAQLARTARARGVIVPRANADEAAAVEGIEVFGVRRLGEVVAFLNGRHRLDPRPAVDVGAPDEEGGAGADVDLGEVRGQEAAKRAITVAAAGGHNVIMLGPAGTGKTMMAKALPGVLPSLTRAEALEVTRIHSAAGTLPPGCPLLWRRPVRTPHHTASAAAIIGGGPIPRPGDVSLAHRGVLFLDEMPEFPRHVLETLRQPLEDGHVTIARVHGAVRFPARFMLVGALNPTPGGRSGPAASSARAMSRYLARLSGPLIDRIDLHVEVPEVSWSQLTAARDGTDTATVRARVAAARHAQHRRQGPRLNAELSGRRLDRHAPLDGEARLLLKQAVTELRLSARAYDRIRRVARTIADLEPSPDVRAHHVAEAVQYRLLDRVAWEEA
ncbi:MAG: YifB family Mg chelatase-like AAA ATPase [Planctomycetota bacterium]|jgi:magnesium chelatase family protein